MNEGPFYINYSINGEHFMVGPYDSRRFAMIHIDDVRRIPGVSNVYLGNEVPAEQSIHRRLLPITSTITGMLGAAITLYLHLAASADWLGWLMPPGTC